MSEVRDTGGMVESSESEKEITEISEVEQMNAAEEEELTPLIDNPLVENDSGLQPEVFTEFSQELVSSEPNGGNDEMSQVLEDDNADPATMTQVEGAPDQVAASDANIGENSGKTEVKNEQLENGSSFMVTDKEEDNSKEHQATEASVKQEKGNEEFQGGVVEGSNQSSDFDSFLDGYDSGTEEQQSAFMKELENFYKERSMEFKPPKFYGEGLNCLKQVEISHLAQVELEEMLQHVLCRVGTLSACLVHVQSDPAGRLVISGEPEQPDNPWGVTPFKKVDG
ncbi:hypothetical protein BHE74_00022075 [Ensete ventricosum]|nr:hypothetical protein BHE74_00022075 [Ensete ventricosum]